MAVSARAIRPGEGIINYALVSRSRRVNRIWASVEGRAMLEEF